MLRKIAVATLALFVGIAIPDTAQAQEEEYECGMQCNTCLGFGKKGEVGTFNPEVMDYVLTGCQWRTTCEQCAETRLSGGTESSVVAQQMQVAPTAELHAIIRRDGTRFLVSTTRNLLVVKGTKCNPNAFSMVVHISKERAADLARLGVRSLESYSPKSSKSIAAK